MKLGKTLPIGLGGLAAALAGWTAWGALSSRVEHARYEVLTQADRYEIRQYPPRLLARASVQGTYKRAVREGFHILLGYILGGNRARERVGTAAPVGASAEEPLHRIAMTAPVLVEERVGPIYTVVFTLPHDYTRETLPEPTDNRVRIIAEPAKKIAVLRFGWPGAEARIREKWKELLDLLARDGVETVGPPLYAGYNRPGTPPWLVRNEVMVEIR